jgi:nucleoside-diphosphate-sugar epimerase
MKVLITGANGFIGRHLVDALLSKGYFVNGFDRQEKPLIENISRYFSGDVLDKDMVEKAMEGIEIVVHLADALIGHQTEVNNEKAMENNFLGTKNVLSAFSKEKSAKKFIYSSSGKVYGDIKFLPITEEHPTLPLSPYGKSKLIVERLIDFYVNSEKSFVIFRIFNVFGPGQKDSFLLPTILNQLKQSQKIVLKDIAAKRDYVYLDDVISAFVLAIEKEIEPGLSIFNICSGKEASAKDIVSEISQLKKTPVEIEVGRTQLRKDEKDVEYGSFEKAKKILGWSPKYSLRQGLEETTKLSK